MPKYSKKKYIKKRKLSKKKKIIGGNKKDSPNSDNPNESLNPDDSNNDNKELADNIANSLTDTATAIVPVIEKSVEAIGPIVEKSIETAGEFGKAAVVSAADKIKETTGINLENKGDIDKSFSKINQVLESEEFKQAVKSTMDILASTTNEVLESDDFKKTSNLVIDESKEIASKSFKAAIQVFLNGLEEVFPFGPIIALSRSGNTIVKAGIDITEHASNIANTSTHLVEKVTNTIAKKLDDVENTQDKFITSDKPSIHNLKEGAKELQKKGGTKCIKKNTYNKSKKVRFQL
jgi:ribosomal protein S7